MLIRKHFAIAFWLLLISCFAPSPLLLRGDDACRRALPSYSVQYAAQFYEYVSHILADQQVFNNVSAIYGDLLLDELESKIDRVRGLAYDTKQADEWERLLLQNNLLQCIYLMASQAAIYHEGYAKMRAENDLQTQLADAQLADENILEIMRNIQNYYEPPVMHSEILNYELLTLADMPLEVSLIFNSSNQQPKLFFELKHPCAKFLYEPNVAERPDVVGYFRTPVDCRRNFNVFNDYTFLLRALRNVARELDVLANRSLTYSDYFLAIVPRGAFAHAQTFVRNLLADLPPSPVFEHEIIVSLFLRLLMDFLQVEYDWQRCHPIFHLITRPLMELWKQIDKFMNNNLKKLKKYENAYNAYIESHNLQNKTKALCNSLAGYNLQIGFTLRVGLGAAIAEGKAARKS